MARRDGGSGRTRFSRRRRVSAPVLGHCVWHRSAGARPAHTTVLGEARATRRPARALCWCWARADRGRADHVSHGLLELRRLLATASWRPGPDRQLCSSACQRPAGTDREGGTGGLLRRRVRRTARHVGDGLGGAGDRAVSAVLRPRANAFLLFHFLEFRAIVPK